MDIGGSCAGLSRILAEINKELANPEQCVPRRDV
jgi:hypothetical protein